MRNTGDAQENRQHQIRSSFLEENSFVFFGNSAGLMNKLIKKID